MKTVQGGVAAAVALLMQLAATAATAGPLTATVTMIPTFTTDAFAFSTGQGINDLGQVTGASRVTGGDRQAFVWSKGGTITALGDLPGGDNFSDGAAINNGGVVTGSSSVTFASQGFHAFRATAGGAMVDLGARPSSAFASFGADINEAGDIVGSTGFGSSFTAYVMRAGGTMTLLGKNGGLNSRANEVNDSGWIAGDIQYASGATRAAVWTPTGIIDLGDLPGGLAYSTAMGLNNAGLVVGGAGAAAGGHAFKWTAAGGLVDLGDLAGGTTAATAWDVNERGDIVGTGNDASGDRAVLWTDEGLIDLNSLLTGADAADWQLLAANAINESRQIVGSGLYRGQQRGFLLELGSTGTPPPPAGVPAPAPWALVLAAGAALVWQRRR